MTKAKTSPRVEPALDEAATRDDVNASRNEPTTTVTVLSCHCVCARDGAELELRALERCTWSNGQLAAVLPKEWDGLRFSIDLEAEEGHELAVLWKVGHGPIEAWSDRPPDGEPAIAGRRWSPVLARDQVKERLAKEANLESYEVPVALVLAIFGPAATDELVGEAKTSPEVLKPPCTVVIRARLGEKLVK